MKRGKQTYKMVGKAININACSSSQTLSVPKTSVNRTELNTNKNALDTINSSHATYPEGEEALLEYLKREISYSSDLYPNDTVVKIPINIVVQKDGIPTVSIDCKDTLLVEEIKMIIREMPRWTPAMLDGEPQIQNFYYNMIFTINHSLTKDDQKTENDQKNDPKKIIRMNETEPEFPGGKKAMMPFLRGEIYLNMYARENGNPTQTIVRFTIEKDGNMTNPVVVRHVDPHIDKVALKLISQMPKWKPATLRGKAIATSFSLPTFIELIYK